MMHPVILFSIGVLVGLLLGFAFALVIFGAREIARANGEDRVP